MNTKLILLIGILAFGLMACQPDKILDPGPCDFDTDLDAYTLVWSDEFDGPEINLDNWSFNIGDGCDRGICGWGNNELQYYTDRPDNAFIEDGNLVIRAKQESFQGYGYTSA
ncbi:MAG: glycoside hydrolase family 16 protein, partial [Bacteroidota bacterium]